MYQPLFDLIQSVSHFGIDGRQVVDVACGRLRHDDSTRLLHELYGIVSVAFVRGSMTFDEVKVLQL